MQGLTADSGASSESSAKGWCGRRVAVDLGRPETKTTPPRTKRSSPGLLGSVRRERGSRRSCGACWGGAAVADAMVVVDGGETVAWVVGWCELGEEEADEEERAGFRALCFVLGGRKETEMD